MISQKKQLLVFRYDFFQQRSSISGLTSPMTSSMHSDLQTTSYSSDMRILMENMYALNVTDRHDDIGLYNTSSVKSKEPRSMIPVRQYTPSSYRTMPSQSQTTDAADVRHSLFARMENTLVCLANSQYS